MTRIGVGGSVILAVVMLVGCITETPSFPAAIKQRPLAPIASPIKRDAQEIKRTIGKLKRNLEKRERLSPLVPPT
jgi:hypothetical protein